MTFKFLKRAVGLLMFVMALVTGYVHGQPETVLRVAGGYLKGQWENEAYTFKGIPYAAPPIGALRFKPTQPFLPWKDTISCLKFGNIAAQYGGKDHPLKGSEDCLTLNVYTPAVKPAAKLPVLVWIHGGAMTAGAGMVQNGHAFADKDSIVTVTINYRLGVFGFLYLGDMDPALQTSGNNGLLDCIMALRWIQKNIPYFGGDPMKVTVMGESAGAKLTSTLLVSPQAKGLFSQLILESGSVQCIRDVNTAIAIRKRLQQVLSAPDAKELLTLTAEKLIDAQNTVCNGAAGTNYFGPVDDQLVLQGNPYAYLRSHKNRSVNILMGTNKAESKLFMSMDKRLYQPDTTVLKDWFGNNYPLVLTQFQTSAATTNATSAATSILTQYMYQMHTYRLARTLSQNGNKIWMYRFDYSRDSLGATHARELPFVWYATMGSNSSTDLKLANEMHQSWVQFIHQRPPGMIENKAWPLYKNSSPAIRVFGNTSYMEKLKNVFDDTRYPAAGFVIK